MTTSIVDIFNTYKNESDTTADSVATTYANLDIEWVVKDGNQTISANTSWGSATADTRNLLVLVKGNLTVDAGYTLTAAARKRGMFIYVNGDLDLNGIISMTAKGASAAGQRVLLLDSGTEYEVPALGGAGAAALGPLGSAGGYVGNNGTSGVATGACGGGGSGGAGVNGYNCYSGAGAAGTSYSGGGGGGGVANNSNTLSGGSAVANGGVGGAGNNGANGNCKAGGGAGNDGGAGAGGDNGGNGTGGLLVIYVTGTLTFGAAGALTSLGTAGGNAASATWRAGGGGGSGAGHIDYFYGAVSGTPTVTVTGGVGGTASAGIVAGNGGIGGAGSSRATEVSLPDLFGSKGGFGFGQPWIFLKQAYDRNKKLWTPKGLILPQDLGFSY